MKGVLKNGLLLGMVCSLFLGSVSVSKAVLAEENEALTSVSQQVELSDRDRIKASCQENCACFNNIVDYRLSDEQAYLFSIFMEQLKTRPETNILEFMDEKEARAIQSVFSICRMKKEPEQKNSKIAVRTNKGDKK